MKNRVRELRTEAGMTQQQLADLVHVSSRTHHLPWRRGSTTRPCCWRTDWRWCSAPRVEDLYCLAENKEQEDRENEEWT